MATRISKKKAKAEIAAVEAHLRAGAPAIPRPGIRDPLAVTLAARDLDVDLSSLRRRVGSPLVKGTHARDHKLSVDWSLAVAGLAEADVVAAAEAGALGIEPVLPGFAIKQVVNRLGAEGESLGATVTQGRAPGEASPIPVGHEVRGLSTFYDGQGRKVGEWVKTAKAPGGPDAVAAIREAFAAYTGHAPLLPPPAETNSALMSVYIITDVHHGLLAYGRESGEDYDIKIGSDRLRGCMRDLVAQSPPSEEALILNLGDYFHSNDQTNTTPTSKHQLDVDSRFFKVAVTGVALHQDIIELALQKHERVRVRILRGNHDPESSIALQIALAAFYHANPRVIVDLDPCDLFFLRFGVTLIGGCHGHTMKPERMAIAMATLRPEDWGLSRFRWFVFGHIHHETVKEVGNVRCESFQTIAAKDAYAAGHGFLSGQSLTSVTIHREKGEIGRHRVSIS